MTRDGRTHHEDNWLDDSGQISFTFGNLNIDALRFTSEDFFQLPLYSYVYVHIPLLDLAESCS